MRKLTKQIFDYIVETQDAFIPDGMTNPVKINGEEMIMYCLYGNDIYECLLDSSILNKLKNLGTWIAHVQKDRDEIYFVTGRCRSLHRYLTECPKDMVIDHKNGNSLDNRLSNLQVVTQGVNMLNKTKYKNSKFSIPNLSERHGFYWVSTNRKFENIEYATEAAIKINEILNYYSLLDAPTRKLLKE